MTLEFIKAHSTKDGRHYTAGQIVDITDAAVAQDLIRQGIAKEQKTGSTTAEPSKGREPEKNRE
jgi:hypothetical protein